MFVGIPAARRFLAVLVLGQTVGLVAPALAEQQQELDAEPSQVNRAQPVIVPEPKSTTVKVETPAVAAPAKPPVDLDGKWSFGGAIRTRIDAAFNSTDARTGAPATRSYVGFDTLILKAEYDSSSLFGAAKYRIYGGAFPYNRENGYNVYFGEFSFLQYGYAGIKLTPEDSISGGVQQVPFGIVPWFGSPFNENLGYALGIEEVYDAGVQYSHVEKDLNYQFGYFPTDGGNYFGISRDAARYTTNIVRADGYLAGGTNNSEQHILVARGEYTVYRDALMSATFGASVWHSSLYNYDTRHYGSKQLEALHFVGTYGPWTFKTIGTRIDIDPRNPGGRNSLITVGAYDATYNMATKGFFWSADLAYKLALDTGPFTAIVPFVDYARYFKDRADFRDSERYIVGTSFDFRWVKGLNVSAEMRIGRNDPFTGAGQFTQSLGAGGDNKYKKAFYVNIGYYF